MILPETAARGGDGPEHLSVQKEFDAVFFRAADQSGESCDMFIGMRTEFGKHFRPGDLRKTRMHPDAVESGRGDPFQFRVAVMIRRGEGFVCPIIGIFCRRSAEAAPGGTPDPVNHPDPPFSV